VAKISVLVTKVNDLIAPLVGSVRNKAEVIRLIAIILVYSAIKIRANRPLLYSTLKPETNSDSPSAKSKGVRLVSARFVINHKIAIAGSKRAIGLVWVMEIKVKSSEFNRVKAPIKINVILTSYEMV
jgi:hypothetical protein